MSEFTWLLPSPPTPTSDAGPAQLDPGVPTGSVVIVVPTATNFMLMAVENIIANLRVQQPANLTLPSLYKRAHLITYQTDEVAVVKPRP